MEISMDIENRKCPYCKKKLDKPYWRHIQLDHPDKFEQDKVTWIQLYKDYRSIGMTEELSIQAICELFNRSENEIKEFLKENGVL